RGPAADERAEVDAAHGVQAAEVVEVRERAARVAGEDAPRQQHARRELQVLPRVDCVVVRQRAVRLRVVRVRGAEIVAVAGDRTELLEHGRVAAERAADDREAVAAREHGQVSELIVERVTEAAALVSDARVDAVVAVEGIAEDAGDAGLALELVPFEERLRALVGSEIEGAVVEETYAPVGAVLQVEVEEVEVGERRHRLERGDEAPVAEHVAHEDLRLGDEQLVRGEAAVDGDVVDEELEAARL